MTKQTYRVPIASEAEVEALLRLGMISAKSPVVVDEGEWIECVAENAETAAKLKELGGVSVSSPVSHP
jgi:hypothetical protein